MLSPLSSCSLEHWPWVHLRLQQQRWFQVLSPSSASLPCSVSEFSWGQALPSPWLCCLAARAKEPDTCTVTCACHACPGKPSKLHSQNMVKRRLFMHLISRCKGRWCFRMKGTQDIFGVNPFKFKVQFKDQWNYLMFAFWVFKFLKSNWSPSFKKHSCEI